jgi:hypothetical protein
MHIVWGGLTEVNRHRVCRELRNDVFTSTRRQFSVRIFVPATELKLLLTSGIGMLCSEILWRRPPITIRNTELIEHRIQERFPTAFRDAVSEFISVLWSD